ncbi:MAG TPA: ATP-binding protein [Anaerolineales bacterium]|nr:ATP-binding protein [Anaerolineales bacterium]
MQIDFPGCISCAKGSLTFSANFQLVAALDPCGYYANPVKPCTCAPALVTKYQKRISGLLLDRIDIHIEVPRVDYEKLSGHRLGESSECIRARVQAARDIQRARFTKYQFTDLVWAYPAYIMLPVLFTTHYGSDPDRTDLYVALGYLNGVL